MTNKVVVIGGGVAGNASALALQQRGLQAVVLERAEPGTLRVGEHLSPESRLLLSNLGLWDAFVADGHLACPGVRSSWGTPGIYEREYIFSPYGDGWNLDRCSFDNSLARAVEDADAEILYNTRVTSLIRTREGWSIEIDAEGRKMTLFASFLVDATGRASAISRKLGAKRIVYDRQQALIAWLSTQKANTDLDATLLIEAVEDGWWYATPLPNNRMVAAFMTDPPLHSSSPLPLGKLWTEKMVRTKHVQNRLGDYQLDDVIVRPANSYRMDRVVGDGWLSVGDAAMAFDPLSSMGINKALRSALAAANVAVRYIGGDSSALASYSADLCWDFEDYLAKRSTFYQQENRWPDQPFWRNRQQPGPVKRKITLQPQTMLRRSDFDHTNITQMNSVMTKSDYESIHGICETPLPAFQVVSQLKQRLTRPISDERAIHFVQIAFDHGLLKYAPI
ncbi:MAG: NAD(P)/FAD-dependent oxidoreductase [Caldilineales bacterium]|nr:NAD(P)/FAD-dependent oxidoreductase [Caldilineales bacterium]